MDESHGIPIQNSNSEDPFIDEVSEDILVGSDDSQLPSDEQVDEPVDDHGSYNEVVSEDNVLSESSIDIGDIFIMLLESRSGPFLSRVTEISDRDNSLKMKDDSDKILSFVFNNGDIILKTDDYEIIDMIKVRAYEPIKDTDDEYKEVEFDSEELTEKLFSDLAQKDDLLSSLIYSMNIYDNESKIKRVQQTIDILLELINNKPEKEYSIPSYLIPIIDDSLKLYDNDNSILKSELTDEINNLSSASSYEAYINNSIRNMKPIETTNGYGLVTDEYSSTYLRNCLQDDKCFGFGGSYTYDERRNNQNIVLDLPSGRTTVVTPDRLRIIGLLEEPYDEYVYSINKQVFKKFTLLETYIYEKLNSKMNLYKKDKIKESFIINDDESDEPREKGKYILHSVSENNHEKIDLEQSEFIKEITDLLLKDEFIRDNIYNYDDLEKILFKYDITFNDLPLSDRAKISNKISENIKSYPKRKFYYKKSKSDLIIKNNALSEVSRVKLSYDLIFKCKKKGERNEYLKRFIDLFTRSSEKEYESIDYLYNKYTDAKILCKHYLYECNISNDNDLFDTMKTVYGSSPEDGVISCKICGCYLCNEDATLFDGFDGDKPMVTREIIDTEKETELERNEYLDDNDKFVKIIRDMSDSFSIHLEDTDIYEILLSFELLDHEQLSDKRYGLLDVSFTDIHPRVYNKINKIRKLEKGEKNKDKKKEYKKERETIIYNFQRWLKNTNRILLLTALSLLIIQTAQNTYFTNNKRSFVILDIESKTIVPGMLKYACAKLKRLSEKYPNEEIWNDTLELFNEKEYNTNQIEIQLGLVVTHCLQPTFPRIVDRVSKLEEYIETKKNNYLKPEWPTFKPLQKNISVIETQNFLSQIDSSNIDHYRKVYGGYTVENNSFVRPITISQEHSLSELLSIPEIEVYKSNSFKVLLRYVVSLYGNRENNQFISHTFNKIIEDSVMKEDILKIFKKHDWSDGFKSLNFHKLRKIIIPELLSLYGSNNNVINSCYSDERSCNEFIHVLINNYDLLLLNTLPKRIYSYEVPTIYPSLPFGRLKDEKSYDVDNNEIPNMIEKLFRIYQKDEMGNLIKKYDDKFYTQFYVAVSLLDIQRVENYKFKSYTVNEESFHFIIDTLRKNNSLEYRTIVQQTQKYDTEKLKIISEKRTEYRFLTYLEKYDNESHLFDIFTNITTYPDKEHSEKLDISLRSAFSDMIGITDGYIKNISNFLAQSGKITSDQKKRFVGVFKDFNQQRIVFKSENLYSILGLFINDVNLKYSHLYGYLDDIQTIFSRLKHNNNKDIKLPKEWKCSESVNNEYMKFMGQDDSGKSPSGKSRNDVYLYLHNNIFVKSKDRYKGFNEYLENNEYITFFTFIHDKIKHMFSDLDMLKGTTDSKYDKRYSNIYMKYHFMKLINEIVVVIAELRNSQSDITSDANDLFQSLEMRDEDIIDDMIDVMSRFLMDLVTHIMFQHYDPSWLFLNEQKLDLSNRLSKQKEREKQVIVDKLDSASREERFAIMEKNKMGISLFYKIGSQNASDYVKSDEYSQQTEEERREKLSEIYSNSNLELETIQGESAEFKTIQEVGEEEVGYDYNEEYDNEDQDYGDEGLDGEQAMEFNE